MRMLFAAIVCLCLLCQCISTWVARPAGSFGPPGLRRLRPMLFLFVGGLIAIAGLIVPAAAQSAAEPSLVAPNSWLYSVWTIVQPIVTVIVGIVGPALGLWIAGQLVRLLNITDEAKRKEVEAQVRDALHSAAANGLRYAMTKFSVSDLTNPTLAKTIVEQAVQYVREKSPDTAKQAGVDDSALSHIILAKVPEVVAQIAAAKAPA